MRATIFHFSDPCPPPDHCPLPPDILALASPTARKPSLNLLPVPCYPFPDTPENINKIRAFLNLNVISTLSQHFFFAFLL